MSKSLCCKDTGLDGDEPCGRCGLGLRIRRSASELQRTHKDWLWTKCVELATGYQTHPEKQGMARFNGWEGPEI